VSSGESPETVPHNLPVRGVVPIDQTAGDDDEDTRLLRVMAEAARDYLRRFPWCGDIREGYYGHGCGGIVAVFFFRIQPTHASIDEWLWVVIGDVPPAYLVIDNAKTPSEALEGYIQQMSKWVALAKQGRSSKDVIPVYVSPTPENAADLEKRLKMLHELMLPLFREAETKRA
jgi:hypothetical protein